MADDILQQGENAARRAGAAITEAADDAGDALSNTAHRVGDAVHAAVTPDGTAAYGGADAIQHGIDDDPTNDAAKGATLGGVGGAAAGALAGAVAGPVGIVVGAVVGGLAGAAASGAAVAAVDAVDNDNTISGIGHGATADVNPTATGAVVDNVGRDTGDTRGIFEKIADAVTGDDIDDKTGKRVG